MSSSTREGFGVAIGLALPHIDTTFSSSTYFAGRDLAGRLIATHWKIVSRMLSVLGLGGQSDSFGWQTLIVTCCSVFEWAP